MCVCVCVCVRACVCVSQISQAPPPISHSDHCHLSFNSNHLHLINTQLSQHYLSTHLTTFSCPISLTRSGLTPTQLLTSRLLSSCSSLVLRVSYVCLSLSVTPAHLRCWSEACAQPRHPQVPGKKTSISISFNILSTSRYLLTILPLLTRLLNSNKHCGVFPYPLCLVFP